MKYILNLKIKCYKNSYKYDHPHDQMSLLDAMNAGCLDISAEDRQGWIRHARRFFPRCIAPDDIRCDMDENLWPNGEDQVD